MEENKLELTIPRHVAIIMDGNRRWAKQRKLPTVLGHAAGAKQVKKLVDHLKKRGITVVTLYAFSTENWKRSEKEVTALMRIFSHFMKKNIASFHSQGGRLNILGDISPLPQFLHRLLSEAIEKTKNNNKFILQLALNYGSRDEMVRSVKKIISAGLTADKIDEKTISQHLDTGNIADPDLIIRTSGEQRLSNFLLWQAAYSELYFATDYLPDFTIEKLDEVLDWYAGRSRRLGK